MEGLSDAPTIAIEAGFSNASSKAAGCFLHNDGGDDTSEDSEHEKGRNHGDHRIGLDADALEHLFGQGGGRSRPPMKIATTDSLNDDRKANNAPTSMAGRSTGNVTCRNVRKGPAPAFIAARSKF